MSKWQNFLPGGGKPSDAYDKSRRAALKNIAVGVAVGCTGSFAAKELLNRPKNVAYAEDAYTAPHQQLLCNGDGFALKDLPEKSPDILVVDGYRRADDWNVDAAVGTEDVYLNQAFLKDVAQLRFHRSSSYDDANQPEEGGVIVEHDYALEFLDAKGRPLGQVTYGPFKDDIKGDRIAEAHDAFPNIHFFNSRGEVIDFTISSSDLVLELPRAQLLSKEEPRDGEYVPPEDIGRMQREVPSATVPPEKLKDIFEPYAAMRDRAKRDESFAATFNTATEPTPLAKICHASPTGGNGAPNPTVLGGLAAELNAASVQRAKGQGRY